MLQGYGGQDSALDRKEFRALWGRVHPEGGGPVEPAEGPPDGPRLQALIAACLAGAAEYRALARRGWSPAPLERLARQKSAHARRLGAAYFLGSGVRYCPRMTAGEGGELLGALRRRVLAEEALRAGLEELERSASDRAVGELCGALARETAEAEQTLRRMVERRMGG